MSEPKRFSHFHLYKNAGSSVIRVFSETFGKSAIAEIDKYGDFTEAKRHTLGITREAFSANPGLRMVSSHRMVLDTAPDGGFFPIPVILLRHPIQRLVSTYRFERRSAFHQHLASAQAARALPLNAWLEWAAEQPGLCNYQTQHLAWGWAGEGSTGLLTGAMARLQLMKKHGVVGVVEDWNGFIQKLSSVETAIDRAKATTIEENSSPSSNYADIHESVISKIEERNQADIALWVEAGGDSTISA